MPGSILALNVDAVRIGRVRPGLTVLVPYASFNMTGRLEIVEFTRCFLDDDAINIGELEARRSRDDPDDRLLP